ncbi:hypothetical protein H1R20_g4372, partial [Candolleomyces eurysporus]
MPVFSSAKTPIVKTSTSASSAEGAPESKGKDKLSKLGGLYKPPPPKPRNAKANKEFFPPKLRKTSQANSVEPSESQPSNFFDTTFRVTAVRVHSHHHYHLHTLRTLLFAAALSSGLTTAFIFLFRFYDICRVPWVDVAGFMGGLVLLGLLLHAFKYCANLFLKFFSAIDREPQQRPVVHHIAIFTAKDALEHLKLRQTDIIKAMDGPDIPTVALAGFNEGLVKQGIATLLQEIHIVLSRDLTPQLHVLEAVGKACSPFPSMIFMPSGTTFRPPVFNAEGKILTVEDLIPPSASQPRFSIALEKGQPSVPRGSTAGADYHYQSPSENTQDGGSQGEQSRNSPTEARGVEPQPKIPRSSSDDELQPGEEGSRGDDGRGSLPRNTAAREGENAPSDNAQGGEHVPSSQGPPVPGDDGGTTQRPHNIHFDITAAIYQPSPRSSPLQKLQLTGGFNFQVTPGCTATVDFTKMQCQAHSNPGVSYRYSQSYLKILIDSYSPRWRLSKHKPKSTRASDGQVKRIVSEKSVWQQALKAGLSLIPFGAPLKAEGGLSRTSERLTSNEAVRFGSRIIQRHNLGVFWWSFHVDDEYERDCGIELGEDTLPSAEMSVLPSANSPNEPLDKLTVEITSFWSLLRKESGGWLSYTPGDSLPPGFSNLCQVICIDLPPSDGNYVSEMHVGAPGKPSQVSTVHSQSAITPTEAVLMFSGGAQSVDGLVDDGKRLVGA